ncbi:MAG: PAS domain S-box protein, partial [Candidatus Electrothrix sp. ATG2]|nr:PAS domain S-box protein [Candidatus Electrothrix sp. ATG2]
MTTEKATQEKQENRLEEAGSRFAGKTEEQTPKKPAATKKRNTRKRKPPRKRYGPIPIIIFLLVVFSFTLFCIGIGLTGYLNPERAGIPACGKVPCSSSFLLRTASQKGGGALVGYEQNELIGHPLHTYLIKEVCTSWVQQLLSGEKPDSLKNYETSLKNACDKEIPVLASASPIYDETGELHGAVFVLRDLRERKEMEERLYRSKRMESIGMMAGGVAHDLNNTLAGIIGYPELLLKTLPEESSLREPLEAIWESGQRAAMVVADLLTVARGAAVAKEVRHLHLLVKKYLDSQEHRKLIALYPGISYEQRLEASRDDILCSPPHIRKCLINLLTNAAEAVVDQGAVVLSTQNKQVDETQALEYEIAAGEYIVLSVEDSGSGI